MDQTLVIWKAGEKMKALNERQLQAHVPIVAWMLIVTNGLVVLAYLLVIAVTGTPRAYIWMRALAFPTLMVVLAAPGLVAGFGLRARKSWARILGIVGAVLGTAGLAVAFLLNNLELPALVVGTLIGLYTIFVLAQEAASSYLSALKRSPESGPRHT
jgi:hypothetical protein